MDRKEFARRRRQFMRMIGKDAIAILPAYGGKLSHRRGNAGVEGAERVVLEHVLGGHGVGLRLRHPVEFRVQRYPPFAMKAAKIRDQRGGTGGRSLGNGRAAEQKC